MQRKIQLNIDELEVASFSTDANDDARGTVAAHQQSFDCGETHYFPATCNTCDPLIC